MKTKRISFAACFFSIVIAWTQQLCGMNNEAQKKQQILQQKQNAMLRSTYLTDLYIDLSNINIPTNIQAWQQLRKSLTQKATIICNDVYEQRDYQDLDNAIDTKIAEINRYNSWTHWLSRIITFNNKALDASLVVPFSQLHIYSELQKQHNTNCPIRIKVPKGTDAKYTRELGAFKSTILETHFPKTQIQYSDFLYPVQKGESLSLPNTYCDSIINYRVAKSAGQTVHDLSPQEGQPVSPTTQYLPSLGNIKSDLTATVTRIPMYAKQFDLSYNHIAGYEDTKKTLSIYALPHAEKRYTLSTADDSMRIDTLKDSVVSDAAWKHSFDKNTVLDTLSLCQKSKKLIYSTHNTTAFKTTSVITCGDIPAKPLSWLAKIRVFLGWQRELENKNSWALDAHVKKIVEIDDSNFACLTTAGDLYHLTKDGLKSQTLIPMDGTKFSDITIDPETDLCALQNQNKDIFTIDKKMLKVDQLTFCSPPEQRPSSKITSLYPKLEFLINNTGNTGIVNWKLQCHNGHILAWKYNESDNKTTYTGVERLKTKFSQ